MGKLDISVEVAFAEPAAQYLLRITIQEGANVEQAVQASGILKLRPDLNLEECKIGIFSRPCALQTLLNPHDRIEIYRSLIIDPKSARRAKARTDKLKK